MCSLLGFHPSRQSCGIETDFSPVSLSRGFDHSHTPRTNYCVSTGFLVSSSVLDRASSVERGSYLTYRLGIVQEKGSSRDEPAHGA